MGSPFHPVLLSGGSGTRLWPLSRKLLPKQFLPLTGSRSLFQETLSRLGGMPDAQPPVVVANEEHRFLAAEQLRELQATPQALLLEPAGRNTAPAITVAALYVTAAHGDGTLLVLPTDHAVLEPDEFRRAAAAALALATQGWFATLGVAPRHATTGYGYIEQGERLGDNAFRIARFVEKPDAARAIEFAASGRHAWNAGVFAFTAQRYLDELGVHCPDVLAAATRAWQARAADLDFIRIGRAEFEASPSISVDYAVMERTSRGAVVRVDMGWSDLGSWPELRAATRTDAKGNATRGDVRLQDVRGSYVYAESRLVAALDVADIAIVETADAVLVSSLAAAQEVKVLVEAIEREGRSEHLSHQRVYRPWGYYESLDAGERFQVKRIMVKPGEALSLQRHARRAEHWVVVSGTARVTRGDDVLELRENESTYIPIGTSHRLENAGNVPLYVVEVQSGVYLGEDDIERIEDRYNRA